MYSYVFRNVNCSDNLLTYINHPLSFVLFQVALIAYQLIDAPNQAEMPLWQYILIGVVAGVIAVGGFAGLCWRVSGNIIMFHTKSQLACMNDALKEFIENYHG